MKPACIILAAVVLSFGTCCEKATAPATNKAASQATPDTWQRSKECATQAEKVIAASDREELAKGFPAAMQWENHYSPKYDKCFVSAVYMEKSKRPSGEAFSFIATILTDAFERHSLATSASLEEPAGICNIDGTNADCTQVEAFITDHMKN